MIVTTTTTTTLRELSPLVTRMTSEKNVLRSYRPDPPGFPPTISEKDG